MNGIYHSQKPFTTADDLHYGNPQDTMMQLMGSGGDLSGFNGSMQELSQHNDKETHQRRPLHHAQSSEGARAIHEVDPRRASMLEFGSGEGMGLDSFQFNPGSLPSDNDFQRPGNIAQRRLDSQRARRQMSHENLALNTDYSNLQSYPSMNSSSPYGAMNSADPMSGFEMSQDFLDSSLMMGMDFSGTPMVDPSPGGATPRDSYSQNNFHSAMENTPMSQSMSTPMPGRIHDPGGESKPNGLQAQKMIQNQPGAQMMEQSHNAQSQPASNPMSNTNPGMALSLQAATLPITSSHGLPTYTPTAAPQEDGHLDVSSDSKAGPFQSHENANTQVIPQYRNAYSSSGFDMLGVLMRVAARPNPQINIGAVDMSCAFVVCDVSQHDVPIVYCSDVFERLTAYTRHEILGRNCRFLQSPDGKIQAGVKRKYVDDKSVLRIKNMITQRMETQISLINYRKGGQPFMNLLTMIPIAWDTDEIKYYVGFQVDLVEQPTSITNKNPGMYMVSLTLKRHSQHM